MKTKFLIYAAIIFFITGLNVPNGGLYYFFAVYLATLALGVFLYKLEKKWRQKNSLITPSTPNPSHPE